MSDRTPDDSCGLDVFAAGKAPPTELTLATVPLLRQGFPETLAKAVSVTLHLDTVTRVDSAGVAWLIHLRLDARRRGVTLEFAALPPQVHALAEAHDVLELIATTDASA